MTNLVASLYRSSAVSRVFHTLLYCLQRELRDCESVLDLGCGPSSPIRYCKGLRRSVGVEPFKQYYDRAVASGTHTELVNAMVGDLDFPPKSFDAVTLIEVIEHMGDHEGLKILQAAERWARKKVIVTSPNGFVPQGSVDGNPLQEHLSGWPVSKMHSLGFRSHGLAGLKALRRGTWPETMEGDVLVSIRLRPRAFWFAIATLSQLVTYYVPALAFGLFSVKRLAPPPRTPATPAPSDRGAVPPPHAS